MENLIKNYEIGYLAVSEGDAEEVIKALKAHKAEILKEGKPKKIRLAYAIKKETGAFFGYVQFALDAASIKPLTEKLKFNQKILRFLAVVLPDTALKQQEMEQSEKPVSFNEQAALPKVKIGEGRKESSDAFINNELLEKKLEEILK